MVGNIFFSIRVGVKEFIVVLDLLIVLRKFILVAWKSPGEGMRVSGERGESQERAEEVADSQMQLIAFALSWDSPALS